jgi:hypothetical protein
VESITKSISSNRNCYEYFASTTTLLRSRKKSKVEYLLSITIGYLATVKGTKDPNNWKRMRILLNSGCAATLIKHSLSLTKSLETTKKQKLSKLSGLLKLESLVLTEDVRQPSHYQDCINTETSHGSAM